MIQISNPSEQKHVSYIRIVFYRTIKELASYDKEIKDQSTKIQKMKDESKDSHDIKQQVTSSQYATAPKY